MKTDQVEAKVKEVIQQCEVLWNQPVKSFIEIGRLLNKAKEEIPHGRFMKMMGEKQLPFTHNTANRLMVVARNKVICAHAHKLPRSWATLHALCFFPEEELERLILKGIIHSQTERPEVEELIRKYEGPPIDDEDLNNWNWDRAQKARHRKKPKPLSEDEKRDAAIYKMLRNGIESMLDSPDKHTLPPKYFAFKGALTKTGLKQFAVWVERFADSAPSFRQAELLVKHEKKSRPKRPLTAAQEAALQQGREALERKTHSPPPEQTYYPD